MKHLHTFENHVLDIETKVKKLEEEKAVQKLKNERAEQDEELEEKNK